MFTLTIETENAAFQNAEQDDETDDQRNSEVARILEQIGNKVIHGEEFGSCFDISGNKVGEFKFT